MNTYNLITLLISSKIKIKENRNQIRIKSPRNTKYQKDYGMNKNHNWMNKNRFLWDKNDFLIFFHINYIYFHHF